MLKLPSKPDAWAKSNKVYPWKIGETLPFNKSDRYEDTIVVYGDSFAEIGSYSPDQLNFTWCNFLAHSVLHNVRSFGVAGGSEQLAFKINKQTLYVEKVYTIIFHTNYWREDRYGPNPLPHMTYDDYKNWDRLLDGDRTLHVYRDDNHKVYDFKNGKSLFCEHWANKETNLDVQLAKYEKTIGTNHMTYYGNLLFAKDVVEAIKPSLTLNDVSVV